MIIISQDGKTIMNYNNAVALGVQHDAENDYYVIQVLYEAYCFDCGKYKTEKRARDVLAEMLSAYGSNKIIELHAHLGNMTKANEEGYKFTPIYNMPKK